MEERQTTRHKENSGLRKVRVMKQERKDTRFLASGT